MLCGDQERADQHQEGPDGGCRAGLNEQATPSEEDPRRSYRPERDAHRRPGILRETHREEDQPSDQGELLEGARPGEVKRPREEHDGRAAPQGPSLGSEAVHDHRTHGPGQSSGREEPQDAREPNPRRRRATDRPSAAEQYEPDRSWDGDPSRRREPVPLAAQDRSSRGDRECRSEIGKRLGDGRDPATSGNGGAPSLEGRDRIGIRPADHPLGHPDVESLGQIRIPAECAGGMAGSSDPPRR